MCRLTRKRKNTNDEGTFVMRKKRVAFGNLFTSSIRTCSTRLKLALSIIFLLPGLSFLPVSTFATSAIACPCSEIKVPENVKDFTVDEGLAYMKSKEYKSEIKNAVSQARQVCLKYLAEAKNMDSKTKSGDKKESKKDLAIVSDIDETVLDNSGYFRKYKDWDHWDKWLDDACSPAIKPTAELLAWARKNGIAIFFITGRREKDRMPTIRNLIRAGLVYDGLYLRGNNDESNASSMKSKYRQEIENMGYKIIVCIGDQYSDLAGGHAEDCQKLPNKIYFIK